MKRFLLLIPILICLFGTGLSQDGSICVDPLGDDANSCTTADNAVSCSGGDCTISNRSDCKRNLLGEDGGVACMENAGDILFIGDGTYQEESTGTVGQGWQLDFSGQEVPDGAEGNHTKIIGESKDNVVLKAISGRNMVVNIRGVNYVTMKQFTVDATGLSSDGSNAMSSNNCSNIRIEDVAVLNAPDDAAQFQHGCTAPFELIDFDVINPGQDQDGIVNGIYMQIDNALIRGGVSTGNPETGGTSLWIHNGHDVVSGVIVEGRTFFGNAGSCSSTSGKDITYRNNFFYGCNRGIQHGYTTPGEGANTGLSVLNNTFDGMVSDGILLGIFTGVSNANIQNNIISNNGGAGVRINSNSSSNTVATNVLFGNSGGGVVDDGSDNTESGTISSDPLFADAPNDDYDITSSSPAKDQGDTIGSFSDDFYGTSRPQGTAWDIGAHEFEETTPPESSCGTSEVTVLDTGNSGLLFSSDATSYAYEITIPEGGDLYTAIHIQPQAVEDVFWNTDEELQLVGSEISSTAPSVLKVYWYRILNPTPTTADLTVNLTGDSTAVVITYLIVSGVDHNNPEGIFQSDQSTGNVGEASLNLSIPEGGLGVIALNREPGSDPGFTADDTETVITYDLNGAMHAWAAHDTVDPLGLTWSASARDWVVGGVAINPASVICQSPKVIGRGTQPSMRFGLSR